MIGFHQETTPTLTGIFTTSKALNDEEVEAIRRLWLEKHRGADYRRVAAPIGVRFWRTRCWLRKMDNRVRMLMLRVRYRAF